MLKTDLVIIGAGPVGLFSCFQAGMLGFSCTIVDVLDFAGGQCAALYPQKPIYDIPGFPTISAQTLIDNLKAQASPFKPNYILGHQMQDIKAIDGGGWLVKAVELATNVVTTIEAKAVIIAAGSGAFGYNKPPLANIGDFEGTSVFYAVDDVTRFIGKKVLIAGGGDSAIDWAIELSGIASMVYVVHRRNKFRATPESMRKLEELEKQGKIKTLTPYQLHGLEGSDNTLSAVTLQHMDGGYLNIETDFMLSFFGLAMNLGPMANWGLDLHKDRIMVNPATMQSNLNGVFAIGDIATYPGKLKLILTGFSEAAVACHNAYTIINPGKFLHFEYSTTKGITSA